MPDQVTKEIKVRSNDKEEKEVKKEEQKPSTVKDPDVELVFLSRFTFLFFVFGKNF